MSTQPGRPHRIGFRLGPDAASKLSDMPRSDYVASIRGRIGNHLLLLPGVTAVIRDGGKFLLARHTHSGLRSLIGGAVEPGEEPYEAVVREVREETGATLLVDGIVGAYGGRPMMVEYPNGDQVAYVTTAYNATCSTRRIRTSKSCSNWAGSRVTRSSTCPDASGSIGHHRLQIAIPQRTSLAFGRGVRILPRSR